MHWLLLKTRKKCWIINNVVVFFTLTNHHVFTDSFTETHLESLEEKKVNCQLYSEISYLQTDFCIKRCCILWLSWLYWVHTVVSLNFSYLFINLFVYLFIYVFVTYNKQFLLTGICVHFFCFIMVMWPSLWHALLLIYWLWILKLYSSVSGIIWLILVSTQNWIKVLINDAEKYIVVVHYEDFYFLRHINRISFSQLLHSNTQKFILQS